MSIFVLGILSLASPQSPALERGAGFEHPLPRDWTRRTDEASKATILIPPEAGEQVQLVLHPVRQGALGTEQEFHDAMLKSVTGQAEVDDDRLTGRTGSFQWTRVKLTTRT